MHYRYSQGVELAQSYLSTDEHIRTFRARYFSLGTTEEVDTVETMTRCYHLHIRIAFGVFFARYAQNGTLATHLTHLECSIYHDSPFVSPHLRSQKIPIYFIIIFFFLFFFSNY